MMMNNETTASQPILMAYVATDLDGHADVGLTIESAKYRAGPGCDTIIALHDISAQFVELEGKRVCEPGDVLASQPKSIGDDAEFQLLLADYVYKDMARRDFDREGKAHAAFEVAEKSLLSFIDSRAPAAQASATIQAAPEGYAIVPIKPTEEMESAYFKVIDKNMKRVMTDARFGRYDNFRAAYTAMVDARPAATIQEPVMVAEPVGEGQAQTSAAFPLMRAAFETSESGPDGYFIKFKFPTLVAMQKAHIEWIAAQLADSTAPGASESLQPVNDPLAERKTADIISRGYKKVGYVLQNEAGEYCLSAQSAVRWLSQSNYWRLMHEQDGKLFGTHAPTEAAQGAQLSRNSGELAQGEDSVQAGDMRYRFVAQNEGWAYSDEGRRRAHPDGCVQVWDDDDMDEWHSGFWRDAD